MLQFRPTRSQEFYAPSRDILGFYRPLNMEVFNIMRTTNPDKLEEVEKLQMLMNGVINEASAGQRKLDMDEIISEWLGALQQIDPGVASEYTHLLTAAFTFRYVLGKREVPDDQIGPEALGSTFSSLYVLAVAPTEISAQLKQHLRAYNHIPRLIHDNTPPCVVEEVDDQDE